MRWPWIGALCMMASCGYPALAPVGGTGGGDDAGENPAFQLWALEPSIAHTGDVITLEGTFPADVMVHFPGGAMQTATVLGAHRATVNVPASATEGELFLTSGTAAAGQLGFRRASFAMELRGFEPSAAQPDGTHQVSTLPTPLAGHASVVIGNSLYVIGGSDGSHDTGNVMRATINADGSLGGFAAVPGVALVTARHGHTVALIGKYLYVMSGNAGPDPIGAIERAPVNTDGSLGPFSTIPGARPQSYGSDFTGLVVGNSFHLLRGGNGVNSVQRALINPDGSLSAFVGMDGMASASGSDGASVVIGNYVYSIGGFIGTNYSDGVDRATINADGTLSSFARVLGAKLTTPRADHTAVVIGDHLYIIGGVTTGGATTGVERATINSDGTLGAFGPISGMALGTRRAAFTTVVAGNHVYVVGGSNGSGVLRTIERASIIADGSLQTFATISGVAMASPRDRFMTAVVNNYLYVFGGPAGGIERASIHADGTLDAFSAPPGVTLSAMRSRATSAVIGNQLYVVGGIDSPGPKDSIEGATIAADGSLGPFAPISTTLQIARSDHTSVVIGNYFYVLGGLGDLQSVERALIGADGSLGTFAIVPGVVLTVGRENHGSAVIGNALYVFGGFSGSNSLNSVERAPINADSSLGAFATVPGVSMAAARYTCASAVIGNYLYLLGGRNAGGVLNSVERATIAGDGSLSTFAIVPGVTLASTSSGASSAVLGNYVYMIGGFDGTRDSNAVARAVISAEGP